MYRLCKFCKKNYQKIIYARGFSMILPVVNSMSLSKNRFLAGDQHFQIRAQFWLNFFGKLSIIQPLPLYTRMSPSFMLKCSHHRLFNVRMCVCKHTRSSSSISRCLLAKYDSFSSLFPQFLLSVC